MSTSSRFRRPDITAEQAMKEMLESYPALQPEQVKQALPPTFIDQLLTQRRERLGIAAPDAQASSSPVSAPKPEVEKQKVYSAAEFFSHIQNEVSTAFPDRTVGASLGGSLKNAADHVATALSDGALKTLYEIESDEAFSDERFLPPLNRVMRIDRSDHALGVVGVKSIQFSYTGTDLGVRFNFGDPEKDAYFDAFTVLPNGQVALDGTTIGTWIEMKGNGKYAAWVSEYLRLAVLDSFAHALSELSSDTVYQDYVERYIPAAVAGLHGESFTPPPRTKPQSQSRGSRAAQSTGSSSITPATTITTTTTTNVTTPSPSTSTPGLSAPIIQPQPTSVPETPRSRFIDANVTAFIGLIDLVKDELSEGDINFGLDPVGVRDSLKALRQAIFDDQIELVRGIADENPEFVIEFTPDDTLVHNIVDRIVIRNSANAHQFLHQERLIANPHAISGFAEQYPLVEFHFTLNDQSQVIYASLQPQIHEEDGFRGVIMDFSILGLPDPDEDTDVADNYEKNIRSILELLANKVLVSCCGRLNEMQLMKQPAPSNGGGHQLSAAKRVHVLESQLPIALPPQYSQHWQFLESSIRNAPQLSQATGQQTTPRQKKKPQLRRMAEFGDEQFFTKALYLSPFGEAIAHGPAFPRLHEHHTKVQNALRAAQNLPELPAKSIPKINKSSVVSQQIRFPQYSAQHKADPLALLKRVYEYSEGSQRFMVVSDDPFDHDVYKKAPDARSLGKAQNLVNQLYETHGESEHDAVLAALQNSLDTLLPDDCESNFVTVTLDNLIEKYRYPHLVLDAFLRLNPHKLLIEQLRTGGLNDLKIVSKIVGSDQESHDSDDQPLFSFHDLVIDHFKGPHTLKSTYRKYPSFTQNQLFLSILLESVSLEELVDVLTQSSVLFPDDVEMSKKPVGFNRLRWEPFDGDAANEKFRSEAQMPLVPLQWMINRQSPDIIKPILGTRFAIIDAVLPQDEAGNVTVVNPFDPNSSDVPEGVDPYEILEHPADSPFAIYAHRVFTQVNISDVMAAIISLRASEQRDIEILDQRSKAEAWEVLCWQLGTESEPEYVFTRLPLGISHKRRSEVDTLLRSERKVKEDIIPSEYDRIVEENRSGHFSRMDALDKHLSEAQLKALVDRGIAQQNNDGSHTVIIQPTASKILIPEVLRGPAQFNGPQEHVTLREHITAHLDRHHSERVELLELEIETYETELLGLDPVKDADDYQMYEQEIDLLRATLRYEQDRYDDDYDFLKRQRQVGAHTMSKLLKVKAPKWRTE